MEDRIAADRALHVLRRQRHSFLNHLQVISGWLQLGQPERARAYLETVAERMLGDSGALRHVPPALALALLELGLEAETHGIQLEWTCVGPVDQFPSDALAALRVEVPAAFTAAGRAPVEDRRVMVRLATGGFTIHTPSGTGEG